MRGDRVGLVGPNGIGKTTLIRLLLGELEADRGSVRQGSRLEIAYFDQHRQQIDPDATVLDVVAEGRSEIEIGGRRQHIIGYLGNFLFSPERARSPVSVLSGGERNRLLLAKLLAKPSNLLVLDEPTNDLDMETLEVLEELLLNYTGTILLVSHDRAFLEQVVTSLLIFEGEGSISEHIGGYESWQQRQRAPAPTSKSSPTKAPPRRSRLESQPRKPSYKERRSLEQLPNQIEALEQQQQQLQQQLASPELYRQNGQKIAEYQQKLAIIESELAQLYGEWERLEQLCHDD